MLKRKWAALLFVLVGGLVVPTARAAEEISQPHVILVGIDHYADPQIKARLHAEADAKAMYDLFASKKYLGVNPSNIKLLLGAVDPKRPSELATRANILKELALLEKESKRDDLVIIAFFGNGAPLGERACYFATDSTFKNRAKDAVASGDIEHLLDPVKSQRFVAFLDCNFLGFDAGKETAPDPNLDNFYREFLGNEDAKASNMPSRVVFLANNGLKPSLNLGEHGIFAQAIIDGLKGKADTEGYEPDGNITVERTGEVRSRGAAPPGDGQRQIGRRKGPTAVHPGEPGQRFHHRPQPGGLSGGTTAPRQVRAAAPRAKPRQGPRRGRAAPPGAHAQARSPAKPAQGLPETGPTATTIWPRFKRTAKPSSTRP